MINWIIGIVVFGFAAFIIVRNVVRLSKGKSTCDCGNCDQGCCSGPEDGAHLH